MQIKKLHLDEEHPLFSRQETDTSHPQPHIPIFYIHDFPAPFCTNPLCFCQRSKHEAARLFSGIEKGTFFLLSAALLLEGRKEAGNTTSTNQPTRTEIHVDLLPGVPQQCQLLGHSWRHTTLPGAKVCALCRQWGYCPGCTPVAPRNAQPFTCTRHAREQVQL
jgi:hypothetical protein